MTAREVMEVLRPLIDERKTRENLLEKKELEKRRDQIKENWTPEQAKRRFVGRMKQSRRNLLEKAASQMWQ
jgi:hypothetical protein